MKSMFSMHDSKHKAIIVTVFGILVVAGAVVFYLSLFGAPQSQAEPEQFTIPTTTAEDHDKKITDDSREIAELLKEKGFIKSTLGFNIAFARRISARCVDCIKPGAY